MNRILRVDLSQKTIQEQEYPEAWLRKYVGGDGLAAKVLYDEVPPGIAALDPESRLVVSAGPLAGTTVLASCNFSVAAKSPLTGIIYNSHCNGTFARQLKFSGYDAVVIQGESEKPVYLWIHDGKAEIRDATALWGKDTWDTEDSIRQELGHRELSCMCIGLAGENLVPMAGIVSDKSHLAARGGLGAVMGSKKLKAIAAYGEKEVPIVEPERFAELVDGWRKATMADATIQGYHKYGTAALTRIVYPIGDLPIKNWSRGTLEGWEKLTGEYIIENMFKRHLTCPSCTIAHGKLLELKGGAFSGECEMPEYEMLVAMGSNIGVTDPTVAAKGGELLDKYGLDALGASNVIGFAMECYEKGLITKGDTGGLDLRFGDYEAAFQMIDKIVKREGLGAILADGPQRAAEYIGKGSEKFAVHIKGMPIIMHDHRSAWGFALAYAIGSAGPAHEAITVFAEAAQGDRRFSIEGKAQLVKGVQEFRSFFNCLGVCSFARGTPPVVADTLSAATGLKFTADDTIIIGRRLINLRRAFNIRHGLLPEDDTLPYRYTDDPPPDGGAKGSRVPIKPLVYDYYNLMGWDVKTGKPYRRTLIELDLEDVAKDLWG